MNKIQQLFKEYFNSWNITLPETDVSQRKGGRINEAGWNIGYVFGKKNDKEYIEVYATHRMTNDRHFRLYDDGSTGDEELEAVDDGIFYDPKIPGDEERQKKSSDEKTKRVMTDLKKKGIR